MGVASPVVLMQLSPTINIGINANYFPPLSIFLVVAASLFQQVPITLIFIGMLFICMYNNIYNLIFVIFL